MKRRAWIRCVTAGTVVLGSLAWSSTVPGGIPSASAALPSGVSIVADLGTGDSADARSLAVLNDKVYFAASDGTHQNSLFVSDGEGGNQLVIDTNPGGDNRIYELVSNGSKLFFSANDGTHGDEWWVSNGTAAGTSMLKDVEAGSGSSAPYGSFVLGSAAYTWIYGTNGYQLWKSDGTTVGTTMIVETVLWDIQNVGTAGGKQYFIGGGGDTDGAYELWVTDGTSGGTHLVKNLFSGWSSSSYMKYFTPFGSSMAFAVTSEASGQYGLWITDGTDAGTTRLYAATGGDLMRGVAAVGGSLYATTSYTYGCTTSRGAFIKSDGTVGGTTKVIGYGCTDYGEDGFGEIGVLGTGLVMNHYSYSTGWELWKSDGTAGGTAILKNLDGAAYNSNPYDFFPISATQTAFHAGSGSGYQLWITDGTADGTIRLTDYGKESIGSLYEATRLVVGTKFFYLHNDFVHGKELWVSDGTLAGTKLAYDVRLTGDSSPGNLTPFGDGALFNARVTGFGYEMLYTDGTTAGTRLVKDIYEGSQDGSPNSLTPVGDLMVFNAANENGWRLWVTDGSEAGTHLLKASGNPASNFSMPSVSLGTTALFTAYDPNNINDFELWVTDGTDAGTVLLKDINPGASASYPYGFVRVGTKAYFVANDGTNGSELWVSDGTSDGTKLVKDINPAGDAFGFAPKFFVLGSTLYFVADDGTNGRELWKSDGTSAGTTLVKDIASGSDSAFDGYATPIMASAGSTLFFVADDGTNGRELWKTDGTSLGTILVKDIKAGSDASIEPYSGPMAVLGSTVFFAADDGSTGTELWKSDGTSLGTVLVKDIWTGSKESAPRNLTAFDSILYLQACSPTAWCEVWTSDGTTAGTTSPFDLTPTVSTSSQPSNFLKLGSRVFFTSQSQGYGQELFSMKQAQTISFIPPEKMKAHEKLTLSATALSGLSVTFAASGNCSIPKTGKDAGKLHLGGKGTCTVTASQAGDADWAAAPDLVATITVDKNSVTVSFVSVVPASVGASRMNPFTFVSGNVRLKAQVTPALEGCDVQFAVSPNSGTPAGPYVGTSDEDGVVLSSPVQLGEGTYDFTVTPLGDCEGLAVQAPGIYLGSLPATGTNTTAVAWMASAFLAMGALLVSGTAIADRRRRRNA